MPRFVRLMRMDHYAKNLIIFAPLFFGLGMENPGLLARTLIAFAAFSLVASSVYIFNDYHDLEEDRRHPEKRRRPLASGEVSKRGAVAAGIVSFLGGAAMAYACSPFLLALIGVYAVVNVGYTLYLKHIAIVDIFTIASGFIIRVLAGSSVTGIELYPWLLIVAFLLALFLATAKRREDVRLSDELGGNAAKTVDGYTLKLLDSWLVVIASVIIVCYIIYTVSPDVVKRMHSDKLYITSVFVLLGIMRYMKIAFAEQRGGTPVDIFWKDRFLQITILCWITAFACLIYG